MESQRRIEKPRDASSKVDPAWRREAARTYRDELLKFVGRLSIEGRRALNEIAGLIKRFALDDQDRARRRKQAIVEHLMAAELSHRVSRQLRNGRAKADVLARMAAIPYPSEAELGISRREGHVIELSPTRRTRIAARLRPQTMQLMNLQRQLEALDVAPEVLSGPNPEDVRTDQEVLLVEAFKAFAGGAHYRLAAVLLEECYRLAGQQGNREFSPGALKARERRFRTAARPPIDLRLNSWCFSAQT